MLSYGVSFDLNILFKCHLNKLYYAMCHHTEYHHALRCHFVCHYGLCNYNEYLCAECSHFVCHFALRDYNEYPYVE